MSTAFLNTIESAIAALIEPLGPLKVVEDQGSWYSLITAEDRHVIWRFVCEKSVWRLEAAPVWAAEDSFDADLLARRYLGNELASKDGDIEDLIRISVDHLVTELRLIRAVVSQAFREDTWPVTRNGLISLGRQRDFELFGRPIPPEGAD